MSETVDWEIPVQAQPRPQDCAFDLERTLMSVVGLRANTAPDAFTAATLGPERSGSGVVIRESGLVLTVGYLITEAETIWLSTGDGRATPGHALAYDSETGLGLVQALGRLGLPAIPLGQSSRIEVGEPVITAAGGGRRHAIKASVVTVQEFAGYWEYFLERAIFTAPAHPFWGGTAVIARDGSLIGVGSLHVQQSSERGGQIDVNMVVPIDLLKPALDDLLSYGRPNRPARPWLGLYAAESGERVVVAGIVDGGPAQDAGLRVGDAILAVGGARVSDLPEFYRQIWAVGSAGVEVPLQVLRDDRIVTIAVESVDRAKLLKTPQLH